MRSLKASILFSLVFAIISQAKVASLPSIHSFDSKRNLETQNINSSLSEQYLGLLTNLNLTGEWFNTNNATQEGDFFYRNYGFITFQSNVTDTLSENSDSDSDIFLQIFDGYTTASNCLTVSFIAQGLEFNLTTSSFSGNITVSQDFGYQGSNSAYNNNTKCSAFVQLAFTDAKASPLANPQDFSNGGGIQIIISNSSCSMSLWTTVLSNQSLPTDYLERYIIMMSVVLLCGGIFGLVVVRGFSLNVAQTKTMGLWGILLLFSWYLAMFSLNISILIIFDNFWFLIPILLALFDCLVIAVVLARYRMLIDIERLWADQRSRNIKFWIQYLFALVVAWAFAIFIDSIKFCYLYLIAPLFLLPQILNKFRNPNRARAHWLANFVFFFPQIFFMIYFFAYENNLLGIKVNLTLIIIFFSIYIFEVLVLALLKLRENPQMIANQNIIDLSIMLEPQSSEQSASEDPNQPRKHYESQCCPICIHDFKSAPVDPRNVEIDPKDIDAAVILKCGHSCHRVCLLKWFEKSKTCPSCRKKATKEKI